MYWTRWVTASLSAAVLATVADALLLQRARSYFTGGFLAADSLESAGAAIQFVAASILSDFGAAAVIAALVVWAAGRRGLQPTVAVVLAALAALIPVAGADFVDYELAAYFGDALNASLLFDLAGRDVNELLAVGSDHVYVLALVGLPLVAGMAWLVLVAARRRMTGRQWPNHPRFLTALVASGLVLAAATTSTALIRRGSDVLDNGLRRKPSGQWHGFLVNGLSDLDGDGYGLLGRPPDQRLFDARVHPYAVDVPGNGVDEDGVAGDLPAAAVPYREASGAAPTFTQHPHVILFVLESFRADVVGTQVNGRDVTPVIDALARRGIASAAAYSHNGYTVQARHHMLTGSLADLRDGTSLLDDFKANGYETAYFSGQDESFGGPRYAIGFDRADVAYDARADRDQRYSTFSTAGSLAVPLGLLGRRVTEFLEARQSSKPLFLYVNFHDTHFPYHHVGIEALTNGTPLPQSEITPARGADLRATYMNTAANVDRAIGRVLDVARRRLGVEPGVLVVADHGESLFDEGFLGHGYALNDAQTRIPLIVSNLPVVLEEPVGQADLRDMLRRALSTSSETAPPRIVRSSRPVFQYLGTFDRPAQIALTTGDRQVAYDFRAQRVRINRGPWVESEALTPADAWWWRELVTTWERMILARAERHRGA